MRAVEMVATPGRVDSLRYRLDAEEILAEHALRQPVFGWGAWGRNRPARMGHDEPDMAPDGLWATAPCPTGRSDSGCLIV